MWNPYFSSILQSKIRELLCASFLTRLPEHRLSTPHTLLCLPCVAFVYNGFATSGKLSSLAQVSLGTDPERSRDHFLMHGVITEKSVTPDCLPSSLNHDIFLCGIMSTLRFPARHTVVLKLTDKCWANNCPPPPPPCGLPRHFSHGDLFQDLFYIFIIIYLTYF